MELFKLLGLELKFSTINHPQTDDQPKRMNALLEEYLRHYVTATQKNCDAPKTRGSLDHC